MRWIWVSTPGATFALGIRDERVVEAPPIVWWAIKKRIGTTKQHAVADFYRRQGAVFQDITNWPSDPLDTGVK